MKLVLLPGLDGTGELFAPLLSELSPQFTPLVIAYPTDKLLDYTALAEYVRKRLPKDNFSIVAESFSGPVAHLLACDGPKGLQRVMFFASFLSNPRPLLLNRAILLLASVAMAMTPICLLRRLMIGSCRDNNLWKLVADTIESVPRRTIIHRLNLIANFKASPKNILIEYFSYTADKDRLVGRNAAACTYAGTNKIIHGPHLLLQTLPKQCAKLIEDYM